MLSTLGLFHAPVKNPNAIAQTSIQTTGTHIDRQRLPVPLTLMAHCLSPPSDADANANGEGEGEHEGEPRPPLPLPGGLPPCAAEPSLAAWVHVTQGATMSELLHAVAERCGFEEAGVALHGVRKGGGRYEAVPLFPPLPGEDFADAVQRPLSAWRAVLFDQAELLVEDVGARGDCPRYLAESELARRNTLVTVGVVRRGGGEKERALDSRLQVRQLGAALGLEEGETAELLIEDPASASAAMLSAPSSSARALHSLPLVPPSSPDMGTWTLEGAGVGHGSRILVKSAKEALLLSLRFRVVAGNDRGPKYTRSRPGQRGALLAVEVDRFSTVQDAKAAMCRAARLPVRAFAAVRWRCCACVVRCCVCECCCCCCRLTVTE